MSLGGVDNNIKVSVPAASQPAAGAQAGVTTPAALKNKFLLELHDHVTKHPGSAEMPKQRSAITRLFFAMLPSLDRAGKTQQLMSSIRTMAPVGSKTPLPGQLLTEARLATEARDAANVAKKHPATSNNKDLAFMRSTGQFKDF